jgi:hypothetical protein
MARQQPGFLGGLTWECDGGSRESTRTRASTARCPVGQNQATTEPAMTKPPPVPPDNQSQKGTGDPKSGNAHEARKDRGHIENPREQGQPGNTAQNTTHQGYQQDR